MKKQRRTPPSRHYPPRQTHRRNNNNNRRSHGWSASQSAVPHNIPPPVPSSILSRPSPPVHSTSRHPPTHHRSNSLMNNRSTTTAHHHVLLSAVNPTVVSPSQHNSPSSHHLRTLQMPSPPLSNNTSPNNHMPDSLCKPVRPTTTSFVLPSVPNSYFNNKSSEHNRFTQQGDTGHKNATTNPTSPFHDRNILYGNSTNNGPSQMPVLDPSFHLGHGTKNGISLPKTNHDDDTLRHLFRHRDSTSSIIVPFAIPAVSAMAATAAPPSTMPCTLKSTVSTTISNRFPMPSLLHDKDTLASSLTFRDRCTPHQDAIVTTPNVPIHTSNIATSDRDRITTITSMEHANQNPDPCFIISSVHCQDKDHSREQQQHQHIAMNNNNITTSHPLRDMPSTHNHHSSTTKHQSYMIQRYTPSNIKSMRGNEKQISQFLQWLRNPKGKPIGLLWGPTGCGKSLLVKLATQQLGYHVQELSLDTILNNTVDFDDLYGNSVNATPLSTAPRQQDQSSNATTRLNNPHLTTKDNNNNRQIKSQPRKKGDGPCDWFEQRITQLVSVRSASQLFVGAAHRKMIILVEAYDAMCAAWNTSFHQGPISHLLQQKIITAKTKTPIILTCSDWNMSELYQLEGHDQVMCFRLFPPNTSTINTYLTHILNKEHWTMSNAFRNYILAESQGDYRVLLQRLQLLYLSCSKLRPGETCCDGNTRMQRIADQTIVLSSDHDSRDGIGDSARHSNNEDVKNPNHTAIHAHCDTRMINAATTMTSTPTEDMVCTKHRDHQDTTITRHASNDHPHGNTNSTTDAPNHEVHQSSSSIVVIPSTVHFDYVSHEEYHQERSNTLKQQGTNHGQSPNHRNGGSFIASLLQERDIGFFDSCRILLHSKPWQLDPFSAQCLCERQPRIHAVLDRNVLAFYDKAIQHHQDGSSPPPRALQRNPTASKSTTHHTSNRAAWTALVDTLDSYSLADTWYAHAGNHVSAINTSMMLRDGVLGSMTTGSNNGSSGFIMGNTVGTRGAICTSYGSLMMGWSHHVFKNRAIAHLERDVQKNNHSIVHHHHHASHTPLSTRRTTTHTPDRMSTHTGPTSFSTPSTTMIGNPTKMARAPPSSHSASLLAHYYDPMRYQNVYDKKQFHVDYQDTLPKSAYQVYREQRQCQQIRTKMHLNYPSDEYKEMMHVALERLRIVDKDAIQDENHKQSDKSSCYRDVMDDTLRSVPSSFPPSSSNNRTCSSWNDVIDFCLTHHITPQDIDFMEIYVQQAPAYPDSWIPKPLEQGEAIRRAIRESTTVHVNNDAQQQQKSDKARLQHAPPLPSTTATKNAIMLQSQRPIRPLPSALDSYSRHTTLLTDCNTVDGTGIEGDAGAPCVLVVPNNTETTASRTKTISRMTSDSTHRRGTKRPRRESLLKESWSSHIMDDVETANITTHGGTASMPIKDALLRPSKHPHVCNSRTSIHQIQNMDSKQKSHKRPRYE